MSTNKVICSYNKCEYLSYQYYQGIKGDITEYERLIQKEKIHLYQNYLESVDDEVYNNKIFLADNLKTGYFSNVEVTNNNDLAVVKFLKRENKKIIPILFTEKNQVSSENRLELEWIKYVFERNGYLIDYGMIHSELKTYKVKIPVLNKVPKVVFYVKDFESNQPRIILNRHCGICEFRESCYSKMKKLDDISLLSKMSKKQILKFERKGLFTVKQLSYTYKPRKKGKKYRENYTHKPELQALAIRTQKIFIQKKPKLEDFECELYFDIEGINELHEYYLFGVLILYKTHEEFQYYYCQSIEEESKMWQWFIELIQKYKKSPIYHYGNYELKVIKRFAKKYDSDVSQIIDNMVNINTYIYGKIYFPVYSNSLKNICNYLGFHWNTENANGITSIVWRKRWKTQKDKVYIEKTVEYNKDDCIALKVLKKYLKEIENSGDVLSEVDYTKTPKDFSSPISNEIQQQFQLVLKSSYEHYEKSKISFYIEQNENKRKIRGSKKGYKGQRKKPPKPTKIIVVENDEKCYKHPNINLKISLKKVASRLIIDLKLTRNGIRKEIIKYKGAYGYCIKCKRYHAPKKIRIIPRGTLYGHGLKAYVGYNRVALRTPYQKIAELVNEQFNESINWPYSVNYIVDLAKYYAETKKQIINKLLIGKIIHADEKPLNIRGETQYAWIFTNGKYVYFKLSKTREADLPIEFLKDFDGTLITDFYPGYDSINCKQQKCWVHLLRDINQDLRNNPFDSELETFVIELRGLLIPIMESVQRFGLKTRFLKKYLKEVDKFYKKIIDDKFYKSEIVNKYQKRLANYQDSLFEFLKSDGIPWHNNQAERGIRHLAKQMAISGYLHESHTPAYLTLLSIMQTCRFMNKSFFQFLFSKETDIEKFNVKRKK